MKEAGREDLLPIGTTLGGRYRIERLLGPTAMGGVYAAVDQRQQREVALKVIWPSYLEAVGDALLKRFVREAHISAALPNPHIVPVLTGAIDPATQIPYLAMPLMQGRDLDQWLTEAAPLDPAVAVRIAIQAGLGLRLAHEYGIVHRDIKPSNIFLEERAEQGDILVRVSDFGVAKIKPVDEQNLTRTGTLLGSPVYMAPEQLLRPHDADPRADVWSLAMTLYHALAGRAPLSKYFSFTDLLLALTQQDIPPLQEAAPWIDPALARVVHGALVRDVTRRCPSIDALLGALEPFARNTTRLTAADLRRLDDDARAVLAARVSVPPAWETPSVSRDVPDTQPHEATSLVGQTIAGRFKLGECVHQGPTAALYEALDDASPCMVKVYRPEISKNPEHLASFQAHLERARKVTHENLVRILAFGTDPDTSSFYVATEKLSGVDLGKLSRNHGALEPGAVARVMVQACQGLAALHSAGLAHANLKPSNFFLHETPEGRLVARLCDPGQPFPLEHAEDEDGPAFSLAGQFALSPMYLSPEQVQGKPATHRSDLWSLALVLYESLAGRKPWQGFHSLGELLLAIQNEEIRPIREVAPWVEGGLAEAVHGGLRRNPSQRYGTVRDMAFALGPFASSARSLAVTSFQMARPDVVIRRSPMASGLDRTELADSSNHHSVPPAAPAPARPADTMVSANPDAARASPAVLALAVLAGLLVVGLSAALLLR